MAFIAPLKGVRFNTEKAGRLDDIVTPPYDVIKEETVNSFVAKNPYSMVRLDITKTPGLGDNSEKRYVEAAALFRRWQEEGILIRDDREALYLYETSYALPSGKKLVRKGLLCLVGLAEFSEGVVKPHEQTFDTVIADRLQLIKHCRAQFSQIFSLFPDRDNTVIGLLEGAESEAAGTVTDADGCLHSIRKITDAGVIRRVQIFFKDKSLYIADGHHRYTTALAYRRYVPGKGRRHGRQSSRQPYHDVSLSDGGPRPFRAADPQTPALARQAERRGAVFAAGAAVLPSKRSPPAVVRPWWRRSCHGWTRSRNGARKRPPRPLASTMPARTAVSSSP